MFKTRKLGLGIILVLIIIISLLIGISIGNKHTIQKQLEETQKLTATSDENSYITTSDHLAEVNASVAKLTEFKKEIASAITEMGVATEENADASTMASNIRSLSEVSDADIKSFSALDMSGSLTGSANPHSGYFPSTFMTGCFKAIDSTTFAATENMRVKITINFSVGGGGTSTSSHYGNLYYNGSVIQNLNPSRTTITFTLDIEKDIPIRLFAYTVRSNGYPITMSMSIDRIIER